MQACLDADFRPNNIQNKVDIAIRMNYFDFELKDEVSVSFAVRFKMRRGAEVQVLALFNSGVLVQRSKVERW